MRKDTRSGSYRQFTYAHTPLLALGLACTTLMLTSVTAVGADRVLSGTDAGSTLGSRVEEVLAHDDGTAEEPVTQRPGQKLAVRFQAPVWATHVTAVVFYIMDDGASHPSIPGAPTTAPFTVWVWRPTPDMLPGVPANDGYYPFPDWYMYPEEAWVRVDLPTPVDITDNDLFPDKKFFVGIEWEYRLNPYVGLDTDSPNAGASLIWNWSVWEMLEGNAMIRAVVWTDTICVPEVIHVDAGGGGDYLTIQDAVDAASACDTILVAPGTYTGPANRNISFGGKNIVLKSQDRRAPTVIDCEYQDRGFYFVDGEDESATVQGFTVKNGLGSGGGIRCVNSWPTVVDCVFTGNDGENYGGGVYCNNAVSPSPSFVNCVFANNSAAIQGGGVLMDFSEVTFTNCTFVGNGASEGGGIHCGVNSAPAFVNCIIAFGSEGGAVHCPTSSVPTFNHCCVFGNAGGDELCGDHYENLFEDPLFCGAPEGDYSLYDTSLCLPANNAWAVLIGALGEGCNATVVQEKSWGAIKAMHR